MDTFKKKMRTPVCILAIFLLASVALAGCGVTSATSATSTTGKAQTPAPFCTQMAVIAAGRNTQFLNPDEANVAIPQGEPRIVTTVNGQPITSAQLEMQVQSTIYNNQIVLAHSGPNVPPTLQAQLTRSPATLRQMLLTTQIDNDIWLSLGKQDGEYASVTAAQKQLKQSLDLLHTVAANDPARIQFEAYLCANHLTEASYLTDPRMVQGMRDSLTVGAARFHAQSTFASTQQSTDPQGELNTYIQSLWSKNSVRVFLAGFVPLRIEPQIQ